MDESVLTADELMLAAKAVGIHRQSMRRKLDRLQPGSVEHDLTLVGEQQENLCRRANTQEIAQFGGLQWVVEAQGLPNLIHEFLHAIFLGRLADDHGFDYREIPLDIELPQHRALLWEELACCTDRLDTAVVDRS